MSLSVVLRLLLVGESAIVATVEYRSKRRRTNHNMMMTMNEEGPAELQGIVRHGQEGICSGTVEGDDT